MSAQGKEAPKTVSQLPADSQGECCPLCGAELDFDPQEEEGDFWEIVTCINQTCGFYEKRPD